MTTSDNIFVRVARPGDLESLVEFNLAMARETEDKSLDRATLTSGVSYLLQNPLYGFYVVAENRTAIDSEVVGSLMITYEWSDWRNALFWWVQSVYVKPLYRRRGVYRALYAEVKDRAASERGVCGFRLYVEKENTVAQQTYRKLGMEESHYLMFEEGCDFASQRV
jgi:ribosomal protein S18 acetylase RimI-like enzyme